MDFGASLPWASESTVERSGAVSLHIARDTDSGPFGSLLD